MELIQAVFVDLRPLVCLRTKDFYLCPTYMIGLINGSIEIKVFTMKIQWFTNEVRSGAEGLVKVLD